MNQRFRLIDDDVFINCTNAILTRYKAVKGVLNVIITDDDETRSHAQNKLYWVWLTQLQNKWGQDKDSLHIQLKRQFLARIYLRDGTDKRLPIAVQNLQVIKELAPHIYESQAEVVANGISTTIASTKQFTEYLNDIYTFSYAKGVLLEIPQDLAWCRG